MCFSYEINNLQSLRLFSSSDDQYFKQFEMSIFLNWRFKLKFEGREIDFVQLNFQTVALVLQQWLIVHLREEENEVTHFYWVPGKLTGRIILTPYLERGYH